MKTAKDIQEAFPGASTKTTGSKGVWQCEVRLNGEVFAVGIGPSLAKAEDTAFYGCVITARG